MTGNKFNSGQLWRLIRGGNLIFTALTMFLMKYFIIEVLTAEHGIYFSDNFRASHDLLFSLLVLSVLFIAAAGYVINDIHDMSTDKINKPDRLIVGHSLDIHKAKILYHSLNAAGIFIGFAVFFSLGKPSLVTIHLLVSAMLYLYAVKHQCNGFLGNVFVSFSTALVILTVWLFEFYTLLINNTGFYLSDKESYLLVFGYAAFAFVFTLMREWAKDMEDMEGDKATGCRNFIVKQGFEKGKKILAVSVVISSLLIGVFQYFLFEITPSHRLFNSVFITLIIVNLISALPLTLKAKGKEDFKKLSSLFKLLMLSGILFMLLFMFV